MTVRGFVTADGPRTVEHGQFGGFPPAADLEADRQLADILVGAGAERLLDGAQDVDVSDGGLAHALVEGVLPALGAHYIAIGTAGGEALHIGDLVDVRLDELRAVPEATLPVALER